MFLLQVPTVINGVPFYTMAKSGLYWLTLIIDSQCLLPWFMIVCYFYIRCQIRLVSVARVSSANSKHSAPPWERTMFPVNAAGRSALRLAPLQLQEGEPRCTSADGNYTTDTGQTGLTKHQVCGRTLNKHLGFARDSFSQSHRATFSWHWMRARVCSGQVSTLPQSLTLPWTN